ncbi:protoporphyrinogen oxidase [Fulvimarina pelagi HTCC2506]|uniref:Release factor glutamine methyltransferase n=1 Tax=Fulvimarina pelagi HTCC2506 TaxID=314231 RepID=Q0G7Y3_9HYPH|nr:peptide chain release factor N(5)-glutamine methyltransferase [Fulvimarina pelagi]EAU42231.1 protoporphyrinogen oxidase [Fulvimarina pelagi HTCC2506]
MTDADRGSTIGDAMRRAVRNLAEAGVGGADFDTRVLMADVLGIETSSLLARRERPIEPDAEERFTAYISRRRSGEPVHRILGKRGFYGHDFELSAGTLEPRPDTEIVVEMGIAFLRTVDRDRPLRVLDIGTGSGVIALSILVALPHTHAFGTDISEDALATARRNAKRLKVDARFETSVTDYAAGITGPLDLAISNPPYIATRDIAGLSSEVRDFDPKSALDGGEDGLKAYRAIAAQVRSVLADDGSVVVEIGIDQKDPVTRIFEACGFTLSDWRKDYGGIVRALRFSREEAPCDRFR